MAAALEEQVLNVLSRAATTWDGLRAELGATPGELDSAIRRLELSRQVTRDRGRFHIHGGTASAPAIAQATSEEPSVPKQTPASEASSEPVTEKVCKRCTVRKPIGDFHKHPSSRDGHDPNCKQCKKELHQARQVAKRSGKPAATAIAKMRQRPPAQEISGPAKPVISTVDVERLLATTQAPVAPVMILHFADGVRIGPLVTSAAGVAQMPFHVDLSAAQVGELVTWWSKAIQENQT